MQHTEQILRRQSIAILHDISGWLVGEHIRRLQEALKAYNPSEARVPVGSSTGGQWTSDGSNGGATVPRKKPIVIDEPLPQSNGGGLLGTLASLLGAKLPKLPPMSLTGSGLDSNGDGPIDSVYPIETLLAGLAALPEELGASLLEALSGFFGGGAEVGTEAGAAAPEEAAGAIETTAHGALRSAQREISTQEAQEAIDTAKQTGDVVTQVGKYGTPQNIYKGSNGVTVVVETSGRNAGNIITLWRY